PRVRGGVVGHGMDRGAYEVAVDPVVVHGEGGDGADRIADLEPVAARADGGDRPGRLITDAGREIRLFDVLAPAEHRLGAIEPQRLDADLDFAFPRRRDIEVLDLQDLGAGGLVESYYPCHDVLLLTTGVDEFARHNQAFGTANLNGTTPLPAKAVRVKACEYVSRSAGDQQPGRELADHDAGGVGVGRGDRRHDRGVGDAQALDAADAQFGVYHRFLARSHRAGAHRMEIAHARAAKKRHRLASAHPPCRSDPAFDQVAEGRLRGGLEPQFDTGHQGIDVGLFRQEVG